MPRPTPSDKAPLERPAAGAPRRGGHAPKKGETSPTKRARAVGVREQSARATRASLLHAAIEVFAEHGFDGGRVSQISQAARSHDRMIYYYFGSKEGLYIAVLEELYRRFDEAEAALELKLDDPDHALETVVRFMIGYYRRHPEFVTLLNTENLHRGRYLSRAGRRGEYGSPAIAFIGRLLHLGIEAGRFRPGLSARDVYLMIAALGYFYQSNRFTLSAFLGEDLEQPAAVTHWEHFVVDAVMRHVLQDGAASTSGSHR